LIGASSKFLSLTKADFKFIAKQSNIPVPSFCIVSGESDIENEASLLNFPVIVKPIDGGGSEYITKSSKCYNLDELVLRTQELLKIKDSALIEEFIIGREFAVMVIEEEGEVRALTPVEFMLPSLGDFLHFEAKYSDETKIELGNENDDLLKRMKEAVCKGYKALEV
jgi:D-alanine-D-alanine ligase-like ATP-grasp enzyme